jgi:hypothetical protein
MIRHRLDLVLRVLRRNQVPWLAFLILLSVGCAVLAVGETRAWPLSTFLLPIVLASVVLSMHQLWILTAVDAVCALFVATLTTMDERRLFGLVAIVILISLVLFGAHSRNRLGVESGRSSRMLVDLRDRLVSQSRLPPLPHGWSAEAVMKSAGGASFAGDFVVAARTHDGAVLEIIVADVSGKGLEAGTRSLMLSSAFGGMLGSLPPDQLLPAANEYLLRQGWLEEFVTAAHVAVDLSTGTFEVRTAGHPPAVQFKAGSGRWMVHWTNGPILGLLPAATYPAYIGQLLQGDALLMYTDGLVETPTRDLAFGIDKLIGEAELLVPDGFRTGVRRLVAQVESDRDDRALVMLVRR